MSLRVFVVAVVLCACAAVPSALVGVAVVAAERDTVREQAGRGRQLAATTATLQGIARESGSAADLAVLRSFLRVVVGEDVVGVVVADEAGRVTMAQRAPSAPDILDENADVATMLRAPLRGLVVVDADVQERDHSSGAQAPAGRVVVFLRRPGIALARVGAFVVVGVIVGGAVALIALALLQRRVLRPLEQVAEGLSQASQGNIADSVVVPQDREVAALVDGYHALVQALQKKELLSRSLSQAVGAQVAADPQALSQPPRVADVAVLFVDVRDFTPLTAALSAQDTVALLDRLLTALVEIVHRHQGHVERFTGDGLVAVWGAPRAAPKRTAHAVAAAVEMGEAAHGLSLQEKAAGRQPFVIGVGVACGTAVVGAVGPAERRIFSVHGAVPALARRVQQEAKSSNSFVLVTEDCFHEARASLPDVVWQKTPPVVVRGVGVPLTLYRPRRATAGPRQAMIDTSPVQRAGSP